ncbi:terminase small subunit [Pseudomonas phage NV1]|uniref:Putative terminase small subunit n=1 Tax=Pseudomonas phage NV1 TaxID=2079543 RepID=A0A2L0HPR5_9CAUD|nr:terminase small subunit [Pseudomonas phage NV1]7JOQ_0 Chain 0, Small Terminase subunit [Pseudomonas phage NV1]7JOQ_1 Chain 1, Small Terminase subunit [Pseudomonas phage NV1]7JOQ_2 Chain 2, Small Terminase subunit [Pseudomonas phage NV1]7JOQ_3 Chain 3, Small Terminase subunit [Pseudomonas phage NV1]7JOQ_4 Chain 4, Small Terminase subunit [Pseudomonas phage NV1]7JOQ_5 Chain 5, Small Terminase subunit [Pseudomonas phage NV1]7JOQ_6 Chain 6, Small Terminase subunit [Pseudomonas phage NV1]7JOQ
MTDQTTVVDITSAPLTPKEKLDLYCEALCDGFNKTQAYIKAGFSAPHAQRNVAPYHRKNAEYIQAYISERIGSDAPAARKVVLEIMNDPNEKGGIRLKAAQDILDRAGFGAKQKIELTTKDVADLTTEDIKNELAKLFNDEPELAKVVAFPINHSKS